MTAPQPDLAALRATIVELEQRELDWQRVDGLLRRLLARLTYAGEGRSDALDDVLKRLRAAAADPMDATCIPALIDALTDAVKALDEPVRATAPVAVQGATAPLEVDPTLLLQLVDGLALGEDSAAALAALRAQIESVADAAGLAAAGRALAALISRRLGDLEQNWRVAGELLGQVSGQLANLTALLGQDDADHADMVSARRALDQRMLGEVRALGDRARRAPDLASLQADVETRLNAVTIHLAALREREQKREEAWQQRTERMRMRIRQLEHSTERMEATLEQKSVLADTDALTGLANRRVLEARMEEICRSGVDITSVLVLDVDHFKSINDRLGHAAGDRALKIVAEQLGAALRPGDFLARYGGEEFVAVVKSNADEAIHVAERLRVRIAETRFRSKDDPIAITLSCGVTTVRSDDSPETVFSRADQALYLAKQGGRNRCHVL